MADSRWVVEITPANFQDQLVERSRERPVVVDFWAPWCGPCRALGPVLERLAAEMDGRFLLAKVNTDDHPQLAQAFRVEGIPAVFAVRDGKLIDHFTGALPEDELRRFLDGITGTATPDPLAAALELEGRDPAAAKSAYRELLKTNPDDPAVRVGLARVLLVAPGNEAEAAGLLAPVDSGELATEAERLRTVIKLREAPHADADLAAATAAVTANPEDAEAKLGLGRVLAARGDYPQALATLLVAAELDRALGRGPVRELMVDVFTIIGTRSPEADEYRDKLRNVLY
jgi:putative thioredoxin